MPGAVINDGDAHRGAPGCGNKPMTSDDGRRAIGTPIAGEDARGTPSTDGRSAEVLLSQVLLAQVLLAQVLLAQASKNRRSADSTSSPTTMPTFLQPRRASPKRRNVASSKPTRSEKRAPAIIGPASECTYKCDAT